MVQKILSQKINILILYTMQNKIERSVCMRWNDTILCYFFHNFSNENQQKKNVKRLFLSSVAMKFHCMSQACQITFRLNFDMKIPSVHLLHNVWNIDIFYLSGVNLLYFPTEYNTKILSVTLLTDYISQKMKRISEWCILLMLFNISFLYFDTWP